MQTEHELKCYSQYFQRICSGQKTFEIRKNDRDFQVGDILHLREFDMKDGLPDYGPDSRRVKIVYMTDFEQKEGYVVLGIKLLEDHSP